MRTIQKAATALSGVMLGTFVLALAVRVLYLAAFRDSPFFSQLMVDAQWHDEWAREWADGNWNLHERAFFRAPLYPFWLSLIYRVFGPDVAAVRIIQAILGASSSAALAGAAFRIRGPQLGWIAGGLAAIYGPLVFFDAELLIPNLLLALLSWSLFVLSGRLSLPGVIAGGLLLGLAGVARPNALMLLLPVTMLVLARSSMRRAALVLGLGLLPALGVTGMNLAAGEGLLPVARQGGVNFYAGNHARATGRTVEIPEFENLISWREFVSASRRTAEQSEGRELTSREISDWWMARGLDWIRENPGDALSLSARKAYYFINAYEIPNNRDPYFERPGILSFLLWKTGWLAFPWGVVFPLAVVGWVAARRDGELRTWADFLGTWILLYGVSIIPFFVTARFRLGVVPAVIVLAALAFSLRRRLFTAKYLMLFGGVLVLVNTSLFGVRTENPAHYLALKGHALVREGAIEKGLEQLERAREQDPGNTTLAYLLAEAYARAERFEEARVLYEQVVADRPDDPDVRFNLGVAYLALGRFDDASNSFQVAARLRPGDVAAWVNLGVAFEGRRMYEGAVDAYREAIRVAPTESLAYLRLARLLGERGGIAVLEEGVRRNPESRELQVALAVADSLWNAKESGQ